MRKIQVGLTNHAVDRYRERLAPALSVDAAQDELHVRLARAELVAFDRTLEYWLRGLPCGRAVVKRESVGGRVALTCLTVVPHRGPLGRGGGCADDNGKRALRCLAARRVHEGVADGEGEHPRLASLDADGEQARSRLPALDRVAHEQRGEVLEGGVLRPVEEPVEVRAEGAPPPDLTAPRPEDLCHARPHVRFTRGVREVVLLVPLEGVDDSAP